MRKPLRSSIKELVKGKQYQITVYLEYDEDKGFYPKLRHLFYGAKPEAEAYLRDWIRELEHPEPEEQAEETISETVGEWLDFWMENDVPVLIKWEQNTLRRAKGIVKHNLKPNIGDIVLMDLSADDILAMYKKLRTNGGRYDRPLSERSVRYVHIILNQSLKQAIKRRKITENPCDGLMPAAGKKRNRDAWVVLDEEQLSEFLRGLKDDLYYPLIYAAAYTGARQSELLGLTWSKILWDDQVIKIEQALHKLYDGEEEFELRERTKNETSTRDVDVTGRVIAVLKKHQEDQEAKGIDVGPDALVFTNDRGEPMNANTLVSDFRKLAKGLKHTGMSFHHLRHTHATILLSRGEYVNEVAERLGHASPRTTYTLYGHVLPKNRRRLSMKFDEYVPE